MKIALWLLGVSALLATAPANYAQETKSVTNAPTRRPPPAPPLVSPELQPNHDVTIRLRAPHATEVKVSGQFASETKLTKDEHGDWSVTVPTVAPGIYEYHFIVDELSVMDPQNSAIKPQRWPGSSILQVPANPPAPWDLQNVPHGVVHEHTYQSKALGKWRRVFVYTPPGIATRGRLPVLYLAHGYSDSEGTWTAHGKAHWILDSLIAARKAKPMLIVMPDAHALPPGSTGFDEYGPANSAAFCRELIEDVIPLVESSYRVLTKPSARAFAGLSMGGHHALTVALNHHDRFGWVGAFSSAPPPESTVSAGLDQSNEVNRDLKLLWIAWGKKDFLAQRNETFVALLKSKGIQYESVETEGDHSWPVWRKYLNEFAPKLFR